ncbi:MAG TPA: lanthionine synthetase LanC family protein, partial [Kofleriaceae bacterium]|nr:lanthionine synthetase LanC family protein [Kofleriaceae bacterium]
ALQLARAIALEVAEVTGPAVDRTVFWAYASNALDEPFANAAYDAALADLAAQILAGASHPMLYNEGLSGMGWALAHVTDDSDGLLARIDRTMLEVVSQPAWRGDYELTLGLVGYGVYFLERLRGEEAAGVARDGLERVVAHLAATAERTDDGARWFTRPELMQPHIRALWPRGRYDCGVAHGCAGVVAMLARAAALPDPPAAARALGEDAARWLIAQRLAPGAVGGRFPALVVPEQPVEPTRSAWCYGDLGVAAALWSAEQHLGLARGLAHATALDGILRPTAHFNIEDVALCHGSAGIAHLYNRLYQATRDPALGDAARQWYAATVVTETPAELPGFALWGAHRHRLIDGAIGVGLALFAAATRTEPAWDRIMLCDLSTGSIA